MNDTEKEAAGYLPKRLRDAVIRTAALWHQPISEIRLRSGRALSVTLGCGNVLCGVTCTAEEVTETAANLCRGSLYAHTEELREGLIAAANGIRAGIAGQAVYENGRITALRDFTALSIRIPHRIEGVGEPLASAIRAGKSTLVYGAPGSGKTTLLREAIPLLSSGSTPLRVAVIDTRLELAAGIPEAVTADVFGGWQRMDGILAAVRTLSPEVIVCDEISGSGDAAAVRAARNAGVTVAASVHGRSENDLLSNPDVAPLLPLFDLLWPIPIREASS